MQRLGYSKYVAQGGDWGAGVSTWMGKQRPEGLAAIHLESFYKDFARMPLELPVGVSLFKGDMFQPPKVWGERTYKSLYYWNEVPKGGHFAAMEQPALFAAEMRNALRQFR